jgi:hypothetical protein
LALPKRPLDNFSDLCEKVVGLIFSFYFSENFSDLQIFVGGPSPGYVWISLTKCSKEEIASHFDTFKFSSLDNIKMSTLCFKKVLRDTILRNKLVFSKLPVICLDDSWGVFLLKYNRKGSYISSSKREDIN